MKQHKREVKLPVVWQRAERRASERMRVHFASVSIDHEGEASTARCENISDGGVRLRVDAAVDIRGAIVVIFDQDAWVSGRVVWQKESHCGIEFDQPIDARQFLFHASGLSASPLATGTSMVRSSAPASASRFREGLRVRVKLRTGKERRAVLHWEEEKASLELLQR